MIAVIRLGYYIPLPSVDMARLPSAAAGASEGERIIRAIYGQASELPASLFDLGISPHINASILVSILLLLPKELAEWQPLDRLREARKEGKAGEAEINGVINNLALVFALWTAFSRARELLPYALLQQWFVPQVTAALVAGTFMVQHCANTITAGGIGNGSTLVICMGIITEYADTVHTVLTALEASALPPLRLAALLAGYLGLVLFTVYLSSAEVRLTMVQYSSTPPQPRGAPGGGQGELFAQARAILDRRAVQSEATATYFPIRLNSSGIMPMIIASAGYYGLLPRLLDLLGAGGAAAGLAGFQGSLAGLLVYGGLVAAMEFLPFGAVNPQEVAEYFSAINVGIKGVAPGKYTVDFLQTKVRQCKLWGGLALGGLAVAAHAFDALCQATLGVSLATTSLVIIVGAVLQTTRQVASLREGPALEQRLDQERIVISSLGNM
ncbi:MAG: pre protein translocase secY subunit [Monoraphidium minutum]|nr:MAG: pre protein translocase secY subunit [Monoraphidium minutum]